MWIKDFGLQIILFLGFDLKHFALFLFSFYELY